MVMPVMNRSVLIVIIASLLVSAVVLLPLVIGPGDEGSAQGAVIAYDPYGRGGQWHKGQLHCHSTIQMGRGS
jgi:hypothetical protein